MIEYTSGDILKANAEALVNPVNCVGVMGAGLALQFKKKFPYPCEVYRRACEEGRVITGFMLVTSISARKENPYYIIHFPTKFHWRRLSKLSTIKCGLIALRKEIEMRKFKSIAVPALGCGLGGLQWEDVKPLIETYLDIDGVQVVVYEPRA